jgi:hypothetical protein
MILAMSTINIVMNVIIVIMLVVAVILLGGDDMKPLSFIDPGPNPTWIDYLKIILKLLVGIIILIGVYELLN